MVQQFHYIPKTSENRISKSYLKSMLRATLFIADKMWKHPKRLSKDKNVVYVWKFCEILIHALTQINHKDTVWRKVNQKDKILHGSTYVY